MFAAWISNKELPLVFIKSFEQANASGLRKIDKVIAENPFPEFDLKKYYNSCIGYKMDDRKKAGMETFLQKLKG